jgi:hypothetical protein
MKTETRVAVAAILATVAADAMAQGGPRTVMWMIGGAVGGGILGFLLGLWWCRHCHDKQMGDKPHHLNDR